MKLYDENKLAAVHQYISDFQIEHGKSPTYRQIMRQLKFSNIGTVFRYIKVLTDRGLIEKDSRGSVAIDENLIKGETITIPLIGSVACGTPILAVENIDGNYAFPKAFFGSGERFMLKAKGSSMIDKGIHEGDIMVVKKQSTADPGQVVIALIDGEATAKIFLPKKDKVILRAANDSKDSNGNRIFKDIIVKDCQILGVVDSCIHKL